MKIKNVQTNDLSHQIIYLINKINPYILHIHTCGQNMPTKDSFSLFQCARLSLTTNFTHIPPTHLHSISQFIISPPICLIQPLGPFQFTPNLKLFSIVSLALELLQHFESHNAHFIQKC